MSAAQVALLHPVSHAEAHDDKSPLQGLYGELHGRLNTLSDRSAANRLLDALEEPRKRAELRALWDQRAEFERRCTEQAVTYDYNAAQAESLVEEHAQARRPLEAQVAHAQRRRADFAARTGIVEAAAREHQAALAELGRAIAAEDTAAEERARKAIDRAQRKRADAQATADETAATVQALDAELQRLGQQIKGLQAQEANAKQSAARSRRLAAEARWDRTIGMLAEAAVHLVAATRAAGDSQRSFVPKLALPTIDPQRVFAGLLANSGVLGFAAIDRLALIFAEPIDEKQLAASVRAFLDEPERSASAEPSAPSVTTTG